MSFYYNDIRTEAQRTSIDQSLGQFVRNFRSSFLNVMGRSGDDPNELSLHQRRGVSF